MKFVIEFGNKKGYHKDNLVVNSAKQAEEIAKSLAMIFSNKLNNISSRSFEITKATYRITWQSETHFVAVSRLDGIDRGSASNNLWKEDHIGEPKIAEYRY